VTLLRRFGGTAAAYGISSVCTFTLTLVVARTLPEKQVALVTLVIATAALAAAVGTGIDAAGARTAVRAGGRDGLGALFARAARLRLACLVATVVPLAGYLLHATGSLASGGLRAAAVASFAVYAIGSCAAYLLCYEPQAAGNTRLQAAIQAVFAVPVLLATLAAALADAGDAGILAALAAGSLPAVGWLAWKVERSKRAEISGHEPEEGNFRSLALALTAGTVAFAIFQRLDLLWVGATRGSSDVAEYAVANRVVSGFSLLTATLVIVGLPTIGAASSRTEAVKALVRLRVPIMAIVGLLGVCVAAAPVVVPFVFGAPYSKSGVLTSILLLQYLPLLTYSLINIPLPFVCGRRTVVLQAIVLLAVEAVWLVVWRGADLTVLAVAPLAGQSAAAAFTWLQFTRADRDDALAVSGAST